MVVLTDFVLFSLICLSSQVTAFSASQLSQRASIHFNKHLQRSSSSRNVPSEGYYNPLSGGGNMLTQVGGTFPPGQGEPLNIIISGNSDAAVLVDQATDGGLQNFFQSFGFGGECLGQHMGSDQAANLGDGHGYVNETAEMRWDYGDPQFGTCKESIQGGDHFRYWTQNGPDGNSGAIFMASSYELPLSQQHDIIPNGYNMGRDWLLGNMTQNVIPTLNLTDSSSYSGTSTANNYTYHNTVQYVSGLLQNTSIGVNHNLTVATNGLNAVDGLVAIVEVKIVGSPSTKSAAILSIDIPFYGSSILTLFLLLSLS